jgi:hypothetical protein
MYQSWDLLQYLKAEKPISARKAYMHAVAPDFDCHDFTNQVKPSPTYRKTYVLHHGEAHKSNASIDIGLQSSNEKAA